MIHGGPQVEAVLPPTPPPRLPPWRGQSGGVPYGPPRLTGQ